MTHQTTLQLNNGVEMPALGLGVFQTPPDETRAAVEVALALQGADQLDAVFTGSDGRVDVMWVQGGCAWQGPVGLSDAGAFSPGAPVTLAAQGEGRLDALLTRPDGRVEVLWVQGGGAWSGPVGIS